MLLDFSLLEKLYRFDSGQAIQDIIALYRQQRYVTINYIYFAQLMSQRLLEGTPNSLQKEYYDALCVSDFFFPDGIALQLFYYRTVGKRKIMPHNLNGTDFSPLLLRHIIDVYGVENIHLGIVNVRDTGIGKDEKYINDIVGYMQETYGMTVRFSRQCNYHDRASANPWDAYVDSLKNDSSAIRVLLSFVGAPYQEIMSYKAQEIISKNRVLMMNQGGTIDYRMGVEKRAPIWVVKARVLETFWRICSNPAKNIRKFWWMFGFFRILAKKLLQLTRR